MRDDDGNYIRPPWLRACWAKGRQARIDGVPLGRNPYGDDVNPRGGVTFNRARWRAWREGWTDQDQIVCNEAPLAE